MSTAPAVRLRRVAPGDVASVLALNAVEVAMLSPMDAARLQELESIADRFDVIEVDGGFGGFVVTFAAGAGYDSPNYRWFTETYADRFYYLDRIVLDPSVRRRGIAGLVYDEVEAAAAAYGRLALEVNLEPPNPASLTFHAKRGYAEVGRLGSPEHLVSLMTKELPAAGHSSL